MRKKALRGFWATCVCLAVSASAAMAAPADVVLYASDAVKTAGNWALVTDSTAAGKKSLSSVDKGWSSTDTALASPANYIEFTFNAAANTPYHVWVRQRAGNNDKYNDSLFAQFSDAITASGARIALVPAVDLETGEAGLAAGQGVVGKGLG